MYTPTTHPLSFALFAPSPPQQGHVAMLHVSSKRRFFHRSRRAPIEGHRVDAAPANVRRFRRSLRAHEDGTEATPPSRTSGSVVPLPGPIQVRERLRHLQRRHHRRRLSLHLRYQEAEVRERRSEPELLRLSRRGRPLRFRQRLRGVSIRRRPRSSVRSRRVF